jgi:peroxiredoxin
MAAVNSTMLPLGTGAVDFTLTDAVSGKPVTLSHHRAGRPVLLAFICNHCPFVVHIRSGLARLGAEAQKKGVAVIGISSNDIENYPEDAPPKMKTEAQRAGYTFPYVFDEKQSVAKAYRAACTPDFFLFDKDGRLYYRGQFDGSRPSNRVPVTGADLMGAIDSMLAGKPAPATQYPSIGCNIKWKSGNEPEYF